MNRLTFVFLFSLLLPLVNWGQQPFVDYINSSSVINGGGINGERVWVVHETSDGGSVSAQRYIGNFMANLGNWDYSSVTKMAADGSLLWSKLLIPNAPQDPVADRFTVADIEELTGGDILVASNWGFQRIHMTLLSGTNGSVLWETVYQWGAGAVDGTLIAYDIEEVNNGTAIVYGNRDATINGVAQPMFFSVNTNTGAVLANSSFFVTNPGSATTPAGHLEINDGVFNSITSYNGGYALAFTNNFVAGPNDGRLFILDANFAQLAYYTFPGSVFWEMIPGPGSDLYLLFETNSGGGAYQLIRFNPDPVFSGNRVIWETAFQSSSFLTAGLTTTANGDAVISGAGLLRFDAATGNLVWGYEYPFLDHLLDPAIANDGGVLAGGQKTLFPDGMNACVLKVMDDGTTAQPCTELAFMPVSVNAPLNFQIGTFSNLVNPFVEIRTAALGLASAGFSVDTDCDCSLIADFTYSPSPICAGDNVTFTSTSTGTTAQTSYLWDITGPGLPFQSPNSSFTYGFTTPGTYTVTLTVSEGASCSDQVTQTIVVNAPPVPSISYSGGDPVINCLENGVTMTVSPTPPGYTYIWYENGALLLAATGNSYTANFPATYTIEVIDQTTGCSATISTTITQEEDCCLPVTNDFTVIGTSTGGTVSLNVNETWAGKYYFTDNTILVVGSGSTLDLTNVDIVFGRGAGIDVVDGSRVRANNSVFRPCDETRTWRGFDFLPTASGHFNECTFKNAEEALRFSTSDDVDVTGTEFYNNQIGIKLVLCSNFYGNISDNTFVVNHDRPEFPVVGQNPLTFDGILIERSVVRSTIAHNNFSFVPGQNLYVNGETFMGIVATNSGFDAFQNEFSDMSRAFDVDEAVSRVQIGYNEISYSVETKPEGAAMRLQNSSALAVCLVQNNEFEINYDAISTAIFLEQADNCYLLSNKIRGFGNGIRALESNFGYLVENEIKNCLGTGISLEECLTDMVVSHNQIHIYENLFTNSLGIYFRAGNGLSVPQVSNVSFVKNCIFDARISMELEGYAPPGNLVPLPWIQDNYLFNYSATGMKIFGFQGAIGSTTNLGDRQFGGRNTFASGDELTTLSILDVDGTGSSLDFNGNFCPDANGWNVTPSVIIQAASGNYPSYAACGLHFPGNGKTEGVSALVRELMKERLPLEFVGEEWKLSPQAGDFFKGLKPVTQAKVMSICANLIYTSTEGQGLDSFWNQVESEPEIDAFALEFAHWTADIHKQDELSVQQRLGVVLGLADGEDLFKVYSLAYRTQVGLSEAEFSQLEEIVVRDNRASQMARDLLHNHSGGFVNPVPALPEIKRSEAAQGLAATGELNYMKVYPNPGQGLLSIAFNVEITDGSHLTVTNVQGKVLRSLPVNSGSAHFNLDLSDLPAGIYLLALNTPSGERLYQKYLKE